MRSKAQKRAVENSRRTRHPDKTSCDDSHLWSGVQVARILCRLTRRQLNYGGTIRLHINGAVHKLANRAACFPAGRSARVSWPYGREERLYQGACGACTVLVDGERTLSCLALAVQYKARRLPRSRAWPKTGRCIRCKPRRRTRQLPMRVLYARQICSAVRDGSRISPKVSEAVTNENVFRSGS